MIKEFFLKDKNNEQIYFHFNDIDNKKKMEKLNNVKLTNGKSTISVRWFDFHSTKKYKASMTLKTALKRGLMLIKNIIKKEKLSNKSLNASGLASIIIKNGKIIIEPQFS